MTPDTDTTIIDQAVGLLARRHQATDIIAISKSPSTPHGWTISPPSGTTSLPATNVLEDVSNMFAKISLDRPLEENDWCDLRDVVTSARGCLLTSAWPLTSGPDPLGAFRRDLESNRLLPDFVGSHQHAPGRRQLIAIFSQLDLEVTPPDSFRVIALITAFNEEDVIRQVIGHLAAQGVDVILIDNWSTDATVEMASTMFGKGLVRIEKFPEDGPSASYDWAALLRREAAIALSEGADWYIHHDADEIRQSPWPDRTLRHVLYIADQCGFNAVDHTQLDFHPTDDGFTSGQSLEDHFRHYTPASVVAQEYRVNAWKQTGPLVDLESSGGHNVSFPDKRVFPYNFLLKHYPIRSQAHGERKVLRERKPRWNPDERRRGWHFQYDHIRKGHTFIRSPDGLLSFDDRFYDSMLLQRLFAVGLHLRPARYSWRSRTIAISFLRRTGLLGFVLGAQRRLRAALRRDVSLGGR